MLVSYQAAIGAEVDAADGYLGSLRDILVDRPSLAIRYLVLSAGWLPGRRLPIVPEVVDQTDWPEGRLQLRVTREQAEHSPKVDEEELLSRQKEYDLARHFGWKPSWLPGPAGMPDSYGLPTPTVPEDLDEHGEPTLWEAKELMGYTVIASGSEVGYVEDLIVDDRAWLVRYLVVDIGNLITGRRALVAPDWIHATDWHTRLVELSISKDDLENSPEFDPRQPVNRDYENRLYDFYGQHGYWDASE